ncbi:MAG TPA: flagellar hook-basal body protein [Synergistales bacterium]|nr:flagellar hook-basal body protein [Synergistales bacterium]
MHRGLYAAASAMIVQESMHDVVANNLANVNTSGFRRRIPVNKSFPEVLMDRIEKKSEDGEIKLIAPPFQLGLKGKFLIGDLSLANVISETYMTTESGAIQVTDNPFDAAIVGEGYFAVQDGAGNIYYTRSGHFQKNGEGQLVTEDGMLVLGDGGPIEVGDASRFAITENGNVIADGAVVDMFQVVTFENPTYLRQVGRTALAVTPQSGAPVPVEAIRLEPGVLEMSNVNVVEEMVRMVEAHRAYESASKVLMTHDELTGKLISSYGRTS